MKKIIFLELFLRIIEEEKWNLFEKIGQLRTPTAKHDSGPPRQTVQIICWSAFVHCQSRVTEVAEVTRWRDRGSL